MRTKAELEKELDEYENFYLSILQQMGHLMMESHSPGTEEARFLSKFADIIAQAEEDAGWPSE